MSDFGDYASTYFADGTLEETAETEGIPAHALGTEVVTTVGNITIKYSPLSYAYIALSREGVDEKLRSVMRAMYLYHEAAQAYKEATTN